MVSVTASRLKLQERHKALHSKVKGMDLPTKSEFSLVGSVMATSFSLGLDALGMIATVRGEINSKPSKNQEIDGSAAANKAKPDHDIIKRATPKDNTVQFRRLDIQEKTSLAGASLTGFYPVGVQISAANVKNTLNGPALKDVVEMQQVARGLDKYGTVANAATKKQLELDARAGDKEAKDTIQGINRS